LRGRGREINIPRSPFEWRVPGIGSTVVQRSLISLIKEPPVKKTRALVLVILAIALLSPSFAQSPKEPVELTMAFFIFASPPSDLPLVQDELNKVLVPKIGAKVKLLPINLSAIQQQSNLMISSGEKLDLLINGTWSFFSFGTQVAKNQLLPLDDLLAKYGQGIVKSMDPGFLAAGKVKGKQYLIPTVRDFAGSYSIVMRKDVCDELKIDPTKVKSLADVESVLKLVKAKRPDLIPLVPFSSGQPVIDVQDYDTIGNLFGVLMDYGSSLKVVDYYRTKEYADHVKLACSWYRQGLIYQDAATNQDDRSVYIKANRAFSYISRSKVGYAVQESGICGQPMVVSELVPAFSVTDSVANCGYAIPRNSSDPAKAMQLLNLLYSDPQVYNLLVYGIEGKHYVKRSDGLIDYPAGIDGKSSPYASFNQIPWELGDEFIGSVWKGNDPNVWKDTEQFNNAARKSKALGFVFDVTPVKDAFAACTNVLNRYRFGLEDGVLDPAKSLPEMNQALKAAGIDKIIAEKQKQLDAWAAENGVK
jgi:ABC-type sugar transport system, periplasmic component